MVMVANGSQLRAATGLTRLASNEATACAILEAVVSHAPDGGDPKLSGGCPMTAITSSRVWPKPFVRVCASCWPTPARHPRRQLITILKGSARSYQSDREPSGTPRIVVLPTAFGFGFAAMTKKSANGRPKGARKPKGAPNRNAPRRPPASARPTRPPPRQWSAEVARQSNALDLEPGVFKKRDPKQIAASLKRSAETSVRKKSDSFRSAMSMLSFYINRAGVNLTDTQRRILTRAKAELRKQFSITS
jgi:hypothetical protein